MNFEYNEEEKMLQNSLRSFFQNEFSTEDARRFMEDKQLNKKIKEQLDELGIIDVLDPDEQTNFGVTFASIALMEAGRRILPFPIIEQMLSSYICRANSSEVYQDLLMTLALENSHDVKIENVISEQVIVSGSFPIVPFAAQCDMALIVIPQNQLNFTDKNNIVFAPISLKNHSITIEELEYFDATYPLYTIKIKNYSMDRKDLIIHDQAASGISFEKIRTLSQLLLSAEMVGGAEQILKNTVEYTKERKQFGQEIAKFQAIKHMAAEMYLLIESAKVAVQYAAWALENGEPDAYEAVLIAKSYTSDSYIKVVEYAIQIHGGIGFTWEFDLHLFLKRAQQSSYMLGNPYQIKENLAVMIFDEHHTGTIKVRG